MSVKQKIVLICALLALLFILPHAFAANVSVTLSVSPTSSNTPVAPTVTWTAQGASTCTASGGWSGAKAPAGTETVAVVNKKTDFTLTCISPTGPATLSWTVPLLFSDGTPLQLITGYQVMIGPDANTLSRGPVLPPTPTTNVVIQAPPGKQFFTLRTETKVNGADIEGPDSTASSKTVVSDSGAATVSVAFAVVPNPPTNFTVQ